MSRTAICIDNSPIKRFLEYFKTESDDMKKHKIFEKIVADIDDYIYFYNNECFQARNKGLVPPLKMRNKALA